MSTPLIDSLLQFQYDLFHEVGSKWVDLPTAIAEFEEHQYGWVKQGLLLIAVFDSHKWKDYARRWRDWCEKFIGHTAWYVRKLMNGAKVVMQLIESGFERLPRCLAQCEPLFKFIPIGIAPDWSQMDERWQAILDAHPLDHHLTANSIKETLGEIDPPKKKRLGLSPDIHAALYRRAVEEGKSPEDLIREWLGEDDPTPEPNETTPPAPAPSEDAIAHWQDDVTQLIQEHDHDDCSSIDPTGQAGNPQPKRGDRLPSGIVQGSDGGRGHFVPRGDGDDPGWVGRGSGRGYPGPTYDRPHSPGNGGAMPHDPLDALHPV